MEPSTHLLFLNFVDSSKESRSAFRKSIRSHVAKDHYRKAARRSPENERHSSPHEKVLMFSESAPKRPRDRPRRLEAASTYQSTASVSNEVDQTFVRFQVEKDQDYPEIPLKHVKRSEQVQEASDDSYEHSPTDRYQEVCDKDVSFRWYLEDPTDVLNIHCRKLGESMPHILYNLSGLIDILGPELEHKMSLVSGVTAKYLMPLVLSDFALLASTALYCISMIRNLKSQCHQTTALLQLRGVAISYVEAALQDPNRATSDQLLAAVSTLANYEVVYGSRTVYRLHWKGLIKMIAIRGGLKRAGREGFMKAMLIWHDANAAALAECSPFLEAISQPDSAIEVDPSIFLSGVCRGSEESDNDSVDFADSLQDRTKGFT